MKISTEKIKKLTKQFYIEQLEDIDVSQFRSILEDTKLTDTSQWVESVGAWSQELSQERKMRAKYEALRNATKQNVQLVSSP